ncbi:MAG: hypothetical protein IH624_17355 [Phycisphaerae bacterium]|nr:hypothetical protein [Phycisphaerae bacterium]
MSDLGVEVERDGAAGAGAGEGEADRQRAARAERTAAGLTAEVARLKEANAQLAAEVDGLRTDGALAAAFAAAGVVDLEAAMLMARSRMEKDGGSDAAAVVAAMRKDKAYLFASGAASGAGAGGASAGGAAAMKTAGVKAPRSGAQRVLEDAARQAVASGSRGDVHEYMRRRRRS